MLDNLLMLYYYIHMLTKIIKGLIILGSTVLIANYINDVAAYTPEGRTVIRPLSNSYEPVWRGTASYYSRAGCLGCHPQMIMANGQPLDDTKPTIAFNQLPLNSWVSVTNNFTGQEIVVQVTDTGGFESLGRIADLNLATKEAINCTDLCEVTIRPVYGRIE